MSRGILSRAKASYTNLKKKLFDGRVLKVKLYNDTKLPDTRWSLSWCQESEAPLVAGSLEATGLRAISDLHPDGQGSGLRVEWTSHPHLKKMNCPKVLICSQGSHPQLENRHEGETVWYWGSSTREDPSGGWVVGTCESSDTASALCGDHAIQLGT